MQFLAFTVDLDNYGKNTFKEINSRCTSSTRIRESEKMKGIKKKYIYIIASSKYSISSDSSIEKKSSFMEHFCIVRKRQCQIYPA